jgi:hypothetical protein
MERSFMLLVLFVAGLALSGCEEGPFGNTPPQGRPDWMKDKKTDKPEGSE